MRVSRAADAYTAKAKATATATATRTRSPATNKAGAGNSSSRCREAEKCPSPVVRAGEGARVIILRQRLPSSSVQQQTRRHVARSSSHQASITCPTGMVRRKDCQDMPVWSAAPATPATPATPVIACRNDSQDARRAAETTASLAHMVRATPMPRRPCPHGQARATSEVSHAQCAACQPDKVLGSIARLFLFRLGLCCLVPAVHCALCTTMLCAIHLLPTSWVPSPLPVLQIEKLAGKPIVIDIDYRYRAIHPLPIAAFHASATWPSASKDARTIPNAAIWHRQQWSHAPKRRVPGPLLVPCSLKKTKHSLGSSIVYHYCAVC
jgi:hypothetical protein